MEARTLAIQRSQQEMQIQLWQQQHREEDMRVETEASEQAPMATSPDMQIMQL